MHRDALLPLLAELVRQETCAYWLAACLAASVPAGQVKSVSEALKSPSVTERGVVQHLEHPELGTVALIRPAHGLAAQLNADAKAPPLLGEDTRGVLRDVLGFDDARIEDLALAGVIACHDVQGGPSLPTAQGAVA